MITYPKELLKSDLKRDFSDTIAKWVWKLQFEYLIDNYLTEEIVKQDQVL